MLKLPEGKGFRIGRGAKLDPPSRGKPVIELWTAPGMTVEFEIKVFDGEGLLFHVGKEGKSDYWSRGEDFGFYVLPDADRQRRSRKRTNGHR